MCRHYMKMNFVDKSCIYTSMTNDYYRYIITRWRLSNHDLRIGTDRYLKPKPPQNQRTCRRCNLVEDEFHAVFICPVYEPVREKYRSLVSCRDIGKFLNPAECDVEDTAKFLHGIEKLRGKRN